MGLGGSQYFEAINVLVFAFWLEVFKQNIVDGQNFRNFLDLFVLFAFKPDAECFTPPSATLRRVLQVCVILSYRKVHKCRQRNCCAGGSMHQTHVFVRKSRHPWRLIECEEAVCRKHNA